jgi:hypothetical protein
LAFSFPSFCLLLLWAFGVARSDTALSDGSVAIIREDMRPVDEACLIACEKERCGSDFGWQA